MSLTRLKILLLPLSLLYGFAVRIRNFLFDHNLLQSIEFSVPVISVGNITVGGTGKTPHIEYLTGLLQDKYKVAILSRGYMRRSKGFILATARSGPGDIGDEPLQMKKKFPEITIAVDSSRRNGIKRIMEQFPGTEVILLDDAFQHRRVKPGLSILLTDYNRLFTRDKLLPGGLLREHRYNSRRADIIIVSKSPAALPENDRKNIENEVNPSGKQYTCFTSVEYGALRNLFSHDAAAISMSDISGLGYHVLLLSGIANPGPLREYIGSFTSSITEIRFRDHHRYTEHDLARVSKTYMSMPAGKRCIITTEKDFVRLAEISELHKIFDNNFFYLPISVTFCDSREQERFNNHILNYAGKNRTDSIISQV